ncbi:hypothetical protein C343_01498 [Cryptococcus neoformans C23]|nr:hypothetical protein C343_01498 [Cryptococcus neoformans var. grubii C23]OWZ49989.1 hypothetical protein C353_01514 [Cryptococcus neoformans var. grubii AD1-83a]OXG65321.1 hypothetical protein C354_01527 [Cryptococcus neoformans var. grubii MW-RSA1955]OXG67188.1 hypothetical protein C351_01352 [Cryptococcus neoformans var. grubii c8]OXG70357.1 hypothetical protein C352_01529 [Cryptococcus neoformans var. grubii CHC193]OXG86925.1 hypothetical protein C349_01589 [Cryptococcus neoformans var. 
MPSKKSPSQPLSISEMALLSSKLFSPNLFPRRLPREPRPPQLAGSKLSPPAAEIDERPTARIRRFKLWSEQVGDLRVTLLDPRRRGYLAKHRMFVVPSPPRPEYGRLSPFHRPFQIDPQPFRLPPLPSPPLTLSPEIITNTKKGNIPKKERERTHERLLEHKWVLDQEHERRFRRGMAAIMADMLEYQESNTMPAESGIGYKWKEGVTLNCVMAFQEFFRAIRKNSTAIYSYLDPIDIAPVANRDEVHKVVKKEELKRKKKEKKKADKKMKREAEARLNEESEILEAEEAEVSRKPVDELRKTVSESQITPDSEGFIISLSSSL